LSTAFLVFFAHTESSTCILSTTGHAAIADLVLYLASLGWEWTTAVPWWWCFGAATALIL
jgi:hypothetical protein